MKNDDVLTGIALMGLAFAAYQFMRPRATSTPATMPSQMRPTSGTQAGIPGQAYQSAGVLLSGLMHQAVSSAPGDQVISGSWATQYSESDPSTYFNDPTAYG